MRISDWSSDVCSSDLQLRVHFIPDRLNRFSTHGCYLISQLRTDSRQSQPDRMPTRSEGIQRAQRKRRCLHWMASLEWNDLFYRRQPWHDWKDKSHISKHRINPARSDERRVGQKCVNKC